MIKTPSTRTKRAPLSAAKKRKALEASLDQIAVPPPFKANKRAAPSLIPHVSKWECFECGEVIGQKKICPFCGYDNAADRPDDEGSRR